MLTADEAWEWVNEPNIPTRERHRRKEITFFVRYGSAPAAPVVTEREALLAGKLLDSVRRNL